MSPSELENANYHRLTESMKHKTVLKNNLNEKVESDTKNCNKKVNKNKKNKLKNYLTSGNMNADLFDRSNKKPTQQHKTRNRKYIRQIKHEKMLQSRIMNDQEGANITEQSESKVQVIHNESAINFADESPSISKRSSKAMLNPSDFNHTVQVKFDENSLSAKSNLENTSDNSGMKSPEFKTPKSKIFDKTKSILKHSKSDDDMQNGDNLLSKSA